MTTITHEPLHQAAITVNIKLTDGHPGVTIVTNGNTTTVTPLTADTTAQPQAADATNAVLEAQIEAMLTRQEGYDDETRSREMLAHLIAQGWEPQEHKSKKGQRYILCRYKGSQRKLSGYLHSDALKFVRDRDEARKQPGHVDSKSYTGFPFNGTDFDTAVQSIAAMQAYANAE